MWSVDFSVDHGKDIMAKLIDKDKLIQKLLQWQKKSVGYEHKTLDACINIIVDQEEITVPTAEEYAEAMKGLKDD